MCIPGPSYPSSLKVSSTSQVISQFVRDHYLGVYDLESGLTLHGRPVWGRTGGSYKSYLHYTSGGYWRIGDDYKSDAGWMRSEQSGLTSVPETGWKVYVGLGVFKSEPGMRVVAL